MIKHLFEVMFEKDPNMAFNSLGPPTLPNYADLIEGLEAIYAILSRAFEKNRKHYERLLEKLDFHMAHQNYQSISSDLKSRFQNLSSDINKDLIFHVPKECIIS